MAENDPSRRALLELEWRAAKMEALAAALAVVGKRRFQDTGEGAEKGRFLDLFVLLQRLLHDAAEKLWARFPEDAEILACEMGLGEGPQGWRFFRDEALRLISGVDDAARKLDQDPSDGRDVDGSAEADAEAEEEKMGKGVTMRAGNKGLTAKVNLWSLETVLDEHDAESARLWIKGQVTHADTGAVEKFNDAGELITILGKWNAQKFRELRDGR